MTIISGGQTGADLMALKAAKICGLNTSGWVPKGWSKKKEILCQRYNLKELSVSGFPVRSMRNVDDSDVTIAFRHQFSPGTDSTIHYCNTGVWGAPRCCMNMDSEIKIHRPCLVIYSVRNVDLNAEQIVNFIREHKALIVNVAGHRRNPPDCPEYCSLVKETLLLAFDNLM